MRGDMVQHERIEEAPDPVVRDEVSCPICPHEPQTGRDALFHLINHIPGIRSNDELEGQQDG